MARTLNRACFDQTSTVADRRLWQTLTTDGVLASLLADMAGRQQQLRLRRCCEPCDLSKLARFTRPNGTLTKGSMAIFHGKSAIRLMTEIGGTLYITNRQHPLHSRTQRRQNSRDPCLSVRSGRSHQHALRRCQPQGQLEDRQQVPGPTKAGSTLSCLRRFVLPEDPSLTTSSRYRRSSVLRRRVPSMMPFAAASGVQNVRQSRFVHGRNFHHVDHDQVSISHLKVRVPPRTLVASASASVGAQT